MAVAAAQAMEQCGRLTGGVPGWGARDVWGARDARMRHVHVARDADDECP
jgi:hypothetical protein